MIELITGLPGNAKTLYTISYVKAWAEKDNRPVYYSGIPDLKLPWIEIDPVKWMECPPGSIVVIDECQRIFRNRSINSQPPSFVTALETHRHLGIDLVFITQHPMLIDPAIRRLTQTHKHLVRIYGMQASTVHSWNAVRENCDKPAGRADSEKTKWLFDKTAFELYKSAELHTMKRQIPFMVKALAIVPIVLALSLYYVYSFVQKKTDENQAAKTTATQPAQRVAAPALPGMPPVGGQQGALLDPVADARRFVDMNTPRIVGLAHTAPKYDDITKPTIAPVPAACVANQARDKCNCYSQQGTLMATPIAMCLDIVSRGYFMDFDPDQNSQVDRESQRTRDSVAVLNSQDRLPISGASTRDVSQVVSMAPEGYGVVGSRRDGVRRPPGS